MGPVQLAAEILEQPHRGRCRMTPVLAAARPGPSTAHTSHRQDPLAGQPADHLGSAAGLAEVRRSNWMADPATSARAGTAESAVSSGKGV